MTTYESLMKRYTEQDSRSVFAHFYYDGQKGETWETPFDFLAGENGIAKRENWNFVHPKFINQHTKYPILTNYLNYTFLRVQQLNLIEYSEDKQKVCFNTGLQTAEEKDIYASFFRNKQAEDKGYPDWTFIVLQNHTLISFYLSVHCQMLLIT